MNKDKSIVFLSILASSFFVITLCLIIFLFFRPSNSLPTQKPCTQEAKLCPDGSSVGRSGPNCEFQACPTTSNSVAPMTSTDDWQIYTSKQFKFSIKYPSNWHVVAFEKPTIDIVPPESRYYSDGGVSIALEYNYSEPKVPASWSSYEQMDPKFFDDSTWAIRNNLDNKILFKNSNNILVEAMMNPTDSVTKEIYFSIVKSFKFTK